MNDLVFLEPNRIDAVPSQIQTPMSKVYVIEQKQNYCKVGVSTEFERRKRTIETQGGFIAANSYSSEAVSNGYEVESRAHELLSPFRAIGEWFEVSFLNAVAAVNKAVEDVGDRNPKLQNAKAIRLYNLPASGEDITEWFFDDSPELCRWFRANHCFVYWESTTHNFWVHFDDEEIGDMTFEMFASITIH